MNKLLNYIRQLNANVADLAEQEKAKRLKSLLIKIGGVLTAIGIIGIMVNFVLFATAGSSAFGENGFTARILVPFFLFALSGFLLVIGSMLLKAGLSILIAGEAAKFTDKSLNDRCECGSPIDDDEIFCSSCGKRVRSKCAECGCMQEPNAQFCKNCGAKLK